MTDQPEIHKRRERALAGIPFGEPIRRAKGRIRRCKECKHTFPTPLEYEDHVEEAHGGQSENGGT